MLDILENDIPSSFNLFFYNFTENHLYKCFTH